MNERIIRTDACIAEGATWLTQREPRFTGPLAKVGPLPLRLAPDGFAALLKIIMGQQVSVASANAIWARLAAEAMTTPEAIGGASEDDLRAMGLSRQKARYALALSQAQIDYNALRNLPSDQVVETLTKVKGVGDWTAQIYTKFNLGRADAFAAGDLALQEGARMVFGLDARPDAKALAKMSGDWSPWRSVAARILWAYYAHMKSSEGVI